MKYLMGYYHLHHIRDKHVTFSWSYAEPVLAPFGSCSSKGCQGRKAFLSPGCPSLQRFEKRRNLSAIIFSPVFFDSYKFQLDLQPVLCPCVSLPWQPFIYSVHTGYATHIINLIISETNEESMQESNLLTIPFISGCLYRLTNRL